MAIVLAATSGGYRTSGVGRPFVPESRTVRRPGRSDGWTLSCWQRIDAILAVAVASHCPGSGIVRKQV